MRCRANSFSMTPLIDRFHHTLDLWIEALADYSWEELCLVPAPGSWSLGQLYGHLLEDTDFYRTQIQQCGCTSAHSQEEATAEGRALLAADDFPERLRGGPSNDQVAQPPGKETLLRDLQRLRSAMQQAAQDLQHCSYRGKTPHPGLGYFSGEEWLQFAEMHLRHHLRQKQRIDAFLLQTGRVRGSRQAPDDPARKTG